MGWVAGPEKIGFSAPLLLIAINLNYQPYKLKMFFIGVLPYRLDWKRDSQYIQSWPQSNTWTNVFCCLRVGKWPFELGAKNVIGRQAVHVRTPPE